MDNEGLEQFTVVKLWVCFAEDRDQGKDRWAIVLQQDGAQVQLLWASTQQVCPSAVQPWEFCVTDSKEMATMGHTKPARYSFRRGGVIVVKATDINEVVGTAPKSVVDRLVRAARQS